MQLPVPLKDSERERMLREHIDLELEIERLIAKRTEVNSEIRPKAKRSAELVHKLDDGAELRDIKCEIREIDETNEVEIVRTDTREIIERRTMTALERQGQWDWAAATQAKIEAAKASAAADSADDLVEHYAKVDASLDDDDDGAPLDGSEKSPAPSRPARKRSSKSKPAKRGKGRSAAAHAR